MITVIVIGIPEFVPKPIHDGTLNGPHKKMYGKQKKPPKAWRKYYVDCSVRQREYYSCKQMISDLIQGIPLWNIFFCKLLVGNLLTRVKVPKQPIGMPHHSPYIFKKMR